MFVQIAICIIVQIAKSPKSKKLSVFVQIAYCNLSKLQKILLETGLVRLFDRPADTFIIFVADDLLAYWEWLYLLSQLSNEEGFKNQKVLRKMG